jgi:hypothetical protein
MDEQVLTLRGLPLIVFAVLGVLSHARGCVLILRTVGALLGRSRRRYARRKGTPGL